MPLIVTQPTAGDVHVNAPLTNFAQKYVQDADAFVSQDAFPNLPVSHQSDLYYQFSRADWYRDEAQERADGTESSGAGYALSTAPYFARVYAFHKDVTDRQRANSDPQVSPDRSAAEFVTQKLMIKRERQFASELFTTSIWTGDSGDQDVNWASTDDPILQVRNSKRAIQGATGFRPNKMLFGRQAWDTLLENDAMLARVTGGATTNQPARVMRELVAQLLELDSILVMDAVVNTAAKGATEAISFIGGDNALLYYAPDTVSVDGTPTAAIQLSWNGWFGASANGLRIKRFRWEAVEGDRVEGQMAFDYKQVAPELGHLFTSVSS